MDAGYGQAFCPLGIKAKVKKWDDGGNVPTPTNPKLSLFYTGRQERPLHLSPDCRSSRISAWLQFLKSNVTWHASERGPQMLPGCCPRFETSRFCPHPICQRTTSLYGGEGPARASVEQSLADLSFHWCWTRWAGCREVWGREGGGDCGDWAEPSDRMVSTAVATTEACLSAEVLRCWEPLGVTGRGLGWSWRPWRARLRPGLVPGERQRRKESGHLWVRPARALHPNPRGQRTSEGGKGHSQLLLLSRDPHARAGEGGFGPVPWESPRKEPRDPLRFQTFPSSFPAKSTSRCLVTHWLPPPCGENWLLGCKTGRSE